MEERLVPENKRENGCNCEINFCLSFVQFIAIKFFHHFDHKFKLTGAKLTGRPAANHVPPEHDSCSVNCRSRLSQICLSCPRVNAPLLDPTKDDRQPINRRLAGTPTRTRSPEPQAEARDRDHTNMPARAGAGCIMMSQCGRCQPP
jgi:hypothetical protein